MFHLFQNRIRYWHETEIILSLLGMLICIEEIKNLSATTIKPEKDYLWKSAMVLCKINKIILPIYFFAAAFVSRHKFLKQRLPFISILIFILKPKNVPCKHFNTNSQNKDWIPSNFVDRIFSTFTNELWISKFCRKKYELLLKISLDLPQSETTCF